jgi:phosphonoacetaldehyde hydrolase
MSQIKAVVFDWAGTMIDFGCLAPVSALLDAFAGKGVAITEADARRDMGLAKRDHVRALMAYPPVRAAWIAARGSPPTEADGDAVMIALEPLMRAAAGRHARLIPGAAETASALAARGVKIGSCTGYTRAMMADILPIAAREGYEPAALVCAGETLEGRPSPLMLWKALVELGAWPASACVKVDDADVGIAEGRAAGAWTVGLAASGNGVGLSFEAWRTLPADERATRVEASAARLRAAGADYVIDTVADLIPVIDQIERRLAAGERPAGPA